MDINYISRLGTVAAACLLLAACGGSGSNETGELSLSITDAPIYDAQKVEVDFTGVEVKPASGPALRFYFCEALVDPGVNPLIVQEGECTDSAPSMQTIDLLKQTAGASFLLLDRVVLPAGRVNWVRLVLADPAGRIILSMGPDESHELTIPSGDQTGLKLNRGFDVPAGGEVHVYIDFDVRKSIVEMHSGMTTSYKLKPTLRLVEDNFGAIAGNVDSGLLPATCLGPSVYVFAGAGAKPDDIERDQDDPISSAAVVFDRGSSVYAYRADFLPPGDYTAAFVCADGGPLGEPADDPDLDDTLSFSPTAGKPATVFDDQTTALDF